VIADQFAYCRIPPEAEALRAEVRGFLREALAGRAPVHRSHSKIALSHTRIDAIGPTPAAFQSKEVGRGRPRK